MAQVRAPGLLANGGGFLLVPLFIIGFGLSTPEASGTSLLVVGALMVPTLLTHWSLGHIDWAIAIPLSIGVIPGARIGAHVTINTGDRRLRYTVGAVLGILALVYAVGELVAIVSD